MFVFQIVGSRGTVEVNPRSLMLTEGSVIGVMLAGATKVSQHNFLSISILVINKIWLSDCRSYYRNRFVIQYITYLNIWGPVFKDFIFIVNL